MLTAVTFLLLLSSPLLIATTDSGTTASTLETNDLDTDVATAEVGGVVSGKLIVAKAFKLDPKKRRRKKKREEKDGCLCFVAGDNFSRQVTLPNGNCFIFGSSEKFRTFLFFFCRLFLPSILFCLVFVPSAFYAV